MWLFYSIYRHFITLLYERETSDMCQKSRQITASWVSSMPTFVSLIFSNHSLKHDSHHLPNCSCCSVISDIIFSEVQSKAKYNSLKGKKKEKTSCYNNTFSLLAKSQEGWWIEECFLLQFVKRLSKNKI